MADPQGRERQRKSVTCADCPTTFEKLDRSTLRRSLRRHLQHEHDVPEPEAHAVAMEAVPPVPADVDRSRRAYPFPRRRSA